MPRKTKAPLRGARWIIPFDGPSRFDDGERTSNVMREVLRQMRQAPAGPTAAREWWGRWDRRA